MTNFTKKKNVSEKEENKEEGLTDLKDVCRSRKKLLERLMDDVKEKKFINNL